jgi:hypothetical protein
LSTVIDAARDIDPELWRRYLGIMLRGISADPDSMPPLEPEPLELEHVDRVMSALRPARRGEARPGSVAP